MGLRKVLEITELTLLMLQLYFEVIVDALSALPFSSVIDSFNGYSESHFVFDNEEVINSEYFDSSSRSNSSNDIRELDTNCMDSYPSLYSFSQNYFDMKSFSKNVYVDDIFFGIIE